MAVVRCWSAEQGFTIGRVYKVEEVHSDGCLLLENDKGETENIPPCFFEEVEMYADDIMECLRERLGLKEDDVSGDDQIMLMTKTQAFDEYLNWKGFLGWGHSIRDAVEQIFGISLKD